MDSFQSLLQQVNDTVTGRLSAWSSAFYGQQRASTAAVAEKIDLVIGAFTSKCSPDFSTDITFVQMPMQYAMLIDKLRATNPRIYALLGARAADLMVAEPLKAKQLVLETIDEVIAAASAAPPAP